MAIQFIDVNKTYRRNGKTTQALKDIYLTIPTGKIFGLIGYSGAGKSTISERDVINNKKNLKFVAVEAAQLPRSKDSIGLSAVPGNFALASKIDLKSALQLEKMDEHYRNRIVVNKKNENSQLTKDINKVITSKAFDKVIDESFVGFDKP